LPSLFSCFFSRFISPRRAHEWLFRKAETVLPLFSCSEPFVHSQALLSLLLAFFIQLALEEKQTPPTLFAGFLSQFLFPRIIAIWSLQSSRPSFYSHLAEVLAAMFLTRCSFPPPASLSRKSGFFLRFFGYLSRFFNDLEQLAFQGLFRVARFPVFSTSPSLFKI